MHKGRGYPQFSDTWLTVTGSPRGFARKQCKINLTVVLVGSTLVSSSDYCLDEGVVDVAALTITWHGDFATNFGDDGTWVLVQSYDDERGANKLNLILTYTIGGVVSIVAEPNWDFSFWDSPFIIEATPPAGGWAPGVLGVTVGCDPKPWH